MRWFWKVAVTFAVSWLLIPLVRRFAWRIGAVDVPADWRRMHRNSIPRAGGLAVFAAVLAGGVIFGTHTPFFGAALKGGILMLAIGLADDVFDLSPWLKFGIQFFAALLTVHAVGFYGGAAVLSIFWLLLLTNAHNFIDGLDGLFGGAALSEGIMLALLFFGKGQAVLALPALLVSASCAGFLCFNRPPASIFAGDCGSGSIGFVLGTLSLPLFAEEPFGIGWLAPVFVFAYPLTDLATAVLRRVLRGKSPFAADRAHLHHRICATGIPQWLCTVLLLILHTALGAVGVCLGNDSRCIPAIAAIAVTVLLMTQIRRFLLHFAKTS